MTSRFEDYLQDILTRLERKIRLTPLLLGGIIDSGGGTGGPPGGFIGFLPQTRVSYDTTEAAISGFWNPYLYTESGILIGASLLDNLNHIRYRIEVLESGGGGPGGSVNIYENDILVASGVTIINFETGLDVTLDAPGQVTITAAGVGDFLGLTDTPNSYSGQANKFVNVKSDETGLEFTQLGSGLNTGKSYVSADDTTDDYLENKIVAGSGISITVLNPGGNEQLEISSTISGITDAIRTKAMVFGQSGPLSVKTLEPRLHVPFDGTITNVTAAVNTAPGGASIILDVFKNGTTIFTTSGNRPTITIGSQQDLTSIPDVTSFVQNDVFTAGIIQVGTTTSGADLLLQVRCLV